MQGSGPAADAEAGWQADARAKLGPLWRELDDSLHRHEAALPAGFALPRWVVEPLTICYDNVGNLLLQPESRCLPASRCLGKCCMPATCCGDCCNPISQPKAAQAAGRVQPR